MCHDNYASNVCSIMLPRSDNNPVGRIWWYDGSVNIIGRRTCSKLSICSYSNKRERHEVNFCGRGRFCMHGCQKLKGYLVPAGLDRREVWARLDPDPPAGTPCSTYLVAGAGWSWSTRGVSASCRKRVRTNVWCLKKESEAAGRYIKDGADRCSYLTQLLNAHSAMASELLSFFGFEQTCGFPYTRIYRQANGHVIHAIFDLSRCWQRSRHMITIHK
jgi:hypothetical protein